jgi:RND family efflux transporter MFP subunit
MFRRALSLLALVAVIAMPRWATAQINGFTQPLREIELASDESGSIAELLVDEGDRVSQNQILARLDDRVQRLQVEAAAHLAASNSSLEAARQSLEKRKLINKRIMELTTTGNATESEMIRADMEYSIAMSRYMAAQEESVSREIDLRRAELMLERRSIRAPFDGIVSAIHRRQGEYLSPLRPELVTIVDISKLHAVFNVASSDLEAVKNRDSLIVTLHDDTQVSGRLSVIGVQTDAESGTIQIKVLIDNAEGKIRSGEQCFLEL